MKSMTTSTRHLLNVVWRTLSFGSVEQTLG
jgi:hypothetical protein